MSAATEATLFRICDRISRSPQLHCLARRELEVACLVARGLEDTAIAAYLGIAKQTVRTYLNQIYQRLALESGNKRVRLAEMVWIASETR